MMFNWRGLRLLLALVVLGGVGVLALTALDLNTLRETLRGARWGFLIPSTLINLVVLGNTVWRWRVLLGFRARFMDCLAANQIGAHLNILLPLRLGDFTRSYLIQRHAKLPMLAILASIGAELTFEMAVLVLILAGVLLILPLPPLLTSAAGLLAVVTVVAAVGILVLARSQLDPHRFLPAPIAQMIHRMQEGVSSLRSNRQFAQVLAHTCLGYGLQVVSNWLLLQAFLPDVTLSAGLVAVVGAGLGLALPLLPGAAGTYELAVTLALSSVGIAPEAAAAFALVLHGQQVFITLVMGSGFMLREGVSLGELRQAAVLSTDTP